MDKTTILMILDGYGVNEKTEGNAVKLANKPNLDRIMSEYPCKGLCKWFSSRSSRRSDG